jgi:hypothetical protein
VIAQPLKINGDIGSVDTSPKATSYSTSSVTTKEFLASHDLLEPRSEAARPQILQLLGIKDL